MHAMREASRVISEVDQERAWEELMSEAEEVFFLVAALDGNENGMTKEELVAAYNGDYKTFASLWVDDDDTVVLQVILFHDNYVSIIGV